jgi:hypothetical protein
LARAVVEGVKPKATGANYRKLRKISHTIDEQERSNFGVGFVAKRRVLNKIIVVFAPKYLAQVSTARFCGAGLSTVIIIRL